MREGVAAFAIGALTLGCGGASPLLHPAQPLAQGEVRAIAGVAAQVVPGSLGDDLARAREIAARDATGQSSPGAPESNPDYAKGALVAAAISPGLSPAAGGRVGVGARFEAGLGYTGRAVRVDMRRAFESGPWALSLGLGAHAVLYGRQQGSELPNVVLDQLHGYGADVPVLAGWQSTGGLYSIWFGPRGGFEHVAVERLTSEPKSVILGEAPIGLEATRWHAGVVLGVATGFRHIHVALEAGVAYQIVNGTYNANEVVVRGVSITPATALWWTF